MIGEDIDVVFHATGLVASSTVPLSVKVSDEFGTDLATASVAMTADASGKATATFTAPSHAYGYYRVEAELPSGTGVSGLGTRPAGFVSYAVVPDPDKRINYGDAASRFGMQGGFSSAQGNVIKYLGVRYLLDGPGWKDLEPDYAGQFAAAKSAAQAKGQSYPQHIPNNKAEWPTFGVPLLSVASVPDWAMEPGSGATGSPSMGILSSAGTQGLTTFAKELANDVTSAYSGQTAHYYQVTWEPAIPQLFRGTPAQLVDFFKSTYSAIHAADAKAIVMGPTLFPGSKTLLSNLWSAGLGKYVDAVSMHPYTTFPPETDGLVFNVREQMQMAQTATGHKTPFVGTEHGFTSGSIGELKEALGNIRTSIILLGEGFKFDFAFYIADFWTHSSSETNNTYGYYWNLNPKLNFGTDKLGPKPAVPAFAAMTYWLDGTTSSGPVSNLSGTQMGYRFERAGTTILALWDYKETSSSLSLPVTGENVQVCNWMGACSTAAVSGGTISIHLGESPTYVIGDKI